MSRKVLMALAVMLCMLAFASCGLKKVDEEQLKKDIMEMDEVQECYESKYAKSGNYELKELKIDKEQFNKDEKEDLIFCNLVIANTYFQVELDAEITYNYYDEGGWVLDKIEVDDIEVEPIEAPKASKIYEFLSEELGSSSISYEYEGSSGSFKSSSIYQVTAVKSELCSKKDVLPYIEDPDIGKGVYGAKLNVEYSNSVLSAEGHYYMIFTDNEWYFEYHTYEDDGEMVKSETPVLRIDDYTADYSSAVGEYNAYSATGNYGHLEVVKVNKDTIDIILTYEIKPYFLSIDGEDVTDEYYCTVEQGKEVSVEFDSLKGSFPITHNYGGTGYAVFDPGSKCWESGGDTFETPDESKAQVEIIFYESNGYGISLLNGLYAAQLSSWDEAPTVADAIGECLSHALIKESYTFSENGKTLYEAFDLNSEDGQWVCLINGQLVDTENYCNEKVKYGDKIAFYWIEEMEARDWNGDGEDDPAYANWHGVSSTYDDKEKVRTLICFEKGEVYGYSKLFYNDGGMVIKREVYDETNNLSGSIECEYDDNGRLVKEETFSGYGVSSGWYTYEYDGGGNLIAESNYDDGKLEFKIKYTYNKNNVVIKEEMVDESGKLTWVTERNDNGDRVSERQYDDGEVTYEEKFTYDSYGNMTSWYESENYYGEPETQTYTYDYDDEGNAISKEYSIDDTSYRCTYEYDEKGNLISENKYEREGDDPDFVLTESAQYEYDSEGNVSLKTIRMIPYDYPEYEGFSVIIYEYDERGNCITAEYYNPEYDDYLENKLDGCKIASRYTYEYDEKDRLILEARYNSDGILEFVKRYDSNGINISGFSMDEYDRFYYDFHI